MDYCSLVEQLIVSVLLSLESDRWSCIVSSSEERTGLCTVILAASGWSRLIANVATHGGVSAGEITVALLKLRINSSLLKMIVFFVVSKVNGSMLVLIVFGSFSRYPSLINKHAAEFSPA
jgi:uncharacterized 2Fe-2S/4Fe-4S cluster protein (DUF4445 family)